ncbi:hypothetical protein ACFX4N_23585 [Priestia sp. YIM B13551]|uniref:hypothetical protein n=1 Tax=Priestia sp. YIM B13551 TaxID=3366306 RepID=UPI00366E5F6D
MEKELEFPLSYSAFIRKRDAAYDGDPNGDYVMAEDVNELQETLERLEQAIGIQELENSVSNLLNDKANKQAVSDFGSPLFINYNGSSINTYDSIEKRINAFSYIPHVMLSKEESSSFDFLVQEVSKSGTQLYGIVNCTGALANFIEADINWFKSKGFNGVILTNFGFENGLTRSLQNSILEFIHLNNMVAIVTGDIETMLFNKPHVNNPLQQDLQVAKGDIYLAQDIFVVNGVKNNPDLITSKVLNLNKAQKEKGIKIFVEDTADISPENGEYYLYGKLLSTLYNLDGYSLAPKSRYALNEKVERYIHGFELGQWQVANPIYVEEPERISRSFSKGVIVFNRETNEAFIEGVGLAPTIYTWQDKQIPGAAVDLVDADYNDGVVNAIVGAINENNSLIHYSKIDGLNGDGSSPDVIKEIVIRAINSSPAALAKNPPDGYDKVAGNNYLHGGVIDYLDASAIKSGTLNIDRIKANIIEAINAYIGTAKIDTAFIGELSADHIAANVVDAINIYASNASIERAKIDQAVIGELSASHIQASVIEAINAYVGNATIDSAKIGVLEADKITTNVIKAINAYIGDATIDNAKIGALTANHIKGMVVDAINLYAGSAKIQAAQIGALEAENIQAGLIEAFEVSATKGEFDSLQAAVIDAINASVENAFISGALIEHGSIGTVQVADGSITDAKIVELTANKIVAGTIDTGQVDIQGENGHLRITGNKLQVFDDQATPVERVSIGDVDGDGSLYGLRVRGEDGQTVLYDEKGVYSEGITDGAITNPKISSGAVENRHITANTITGDRLVVDAITAREIAAKSITANEIMANAITAGSGVIAKGAIGEAEIAEASITDAHIKKLSADSISAGSIQMTSRNLVANSSFKKGLIDWTTDSRLNIAEVSQTVRLNQTNSIHLFSTGQTTLSYLSAYSKFVPASPGENYAASVYILSKNLASYDGGQGKVEIEFYNDTARLSWKTAGVTLTITDTWVRTTVTATAPAGTTQVRLRLYHPQNGDTFFCRPMLQRGNIVTEWTGDGSYMTEDGVYTGELTADQITAGKIKAEFIQIGDDTSFAPGYSPSELRSEMEDRIPYRVEVISTNGIVFRHGNIATTLKATVYRGADNITDEIDATRFTWKRVGADGADDLVWNDAHKGMKQVNITKDDVYQRATFLCEISES